MCFWREDNGFLLFWQARRPPPASALVTEWCEGWHGIPPSQSWVRSHQHSHTANTHTHTHRAHIHTAHTRSHTHTAHARCVAGTLLCPTLSSRPFYDSPGTYCADVKVWQDKPLYRTLLLAPLLFHARPPKHTILTKLWQRCDVRSCVFSPSLPPPLLFLCFPLLLFTCRSPPSVLIQMVVLAALAQSWPSPHTKTHPTLVSTCYGGCPKALPLVSNLPPCLRLSLLNHLFLLYCAVVGSLGRVTCTGGATKASST